MNEKKKLPDKTLYAISLLRVFIGWHFLFEGVMKLYNPGWSAKAYLLSAETMTVFYQWLAGESLIGVVDSLNVVILILVGLTLTLGFMEKQGAVCGIGLLILYYFAHPAFMNSAQLGAEGNYWIVNKNLIEVAALLVLYMIPTGSFFGLDIFRKTSTQLKTT